MNLLTLDFGNTHARAALFRNHELALSAAATEMPQKLKELGLSLTDVDGVLSQVKARDGLIDDWMKEGLPLTRLKDYWRGKKFAGMDVHYAQTLGEDRLIQAYWAFKNLSGTTLLLDAGTFFTMDIINGEGFAGGFILPGLKLLSEDLVAGEQLRPSSWEIPSEILRNEALPDTTESALLGGAVAYAALIQRLMQRWSPTQIVISGGNADMIHHWLKVLTPTIPLHSKPDLVHWALKDWYQRNICP